MSKTTTIEQAYFHISNGGLSFSIVERLDTRKSKIYPPAEPNTGKEIKSPDDMKVWQAWHDALPTEIMYNRSWRFRVTTNNFGSRTEFNFPLVPLMVRWTIQALERVLVRMETPTGKNTDGFEHAFRDLNYCQVSAKDGVTMDDYWPTRPEFSSSGASD